MDRETAAKYDCYIGDEELKEGEVFLELSSLTPFMSKDSFPEKKLNINIVCGMSKYNKDLLDLILRMDLVSEININLTD